ncbi:MAG: squalene/phytoene synthase family protein, partial [Alphaproteobacteria bacterium]
MQRKPLSPCADQVRRADPDRYLTALYAAAEAREDLFALYALNDELARAREVTDEPLVSALRLQWWRDALDAAASPGPFSPQRLPRHTVPRHPVAEGVARAQARRPWDAGLVERLIAAREDDPRPSPPADLQAVEARAEATAGTLAALALGVLAIDDPLTAEAARHGAIAYGLAGVLRATAALAARRIVVLPANAMAAEGLTSG